jgi:formylglycine-generating enzyme required for sulfatase activity
MTARRAVLLVAAAWGVAPFLAGACGSSPSGGGGEGGAPDAGEGGAVDVGPREAGGAPDAASDGASDGGGDFDAPPDAPAIDAAPACVEGALRCTGSTPQTCVMGAWQSGASCGAGCDAGACDVVPPSCQGGGAGAGDDCAPTGARDCCGSFEVAGGAFYRSYDGFSYPNKDAPATVSGFRLDAYEATVGRFRKFVAATSAGYFPAAGAGKHAYLAGGGLNAGTEPGWDPTWSAGIAGTTAAWNANLACKAGYATWTPSAGANEHLPVTCLDWYEAYAFCIWDGGFLPSEAEWNYAAAGGGGSNGQRVYPWGGLAIDPSDAQYACGGAGCIDSVGDHPAGTGAFGQSDLAGNLWEWTLDGYTSAFVVPCDDCASLTTTTQRVFRGGGYLNPPAILEVGYRDPESPALRYWDFGVRCARAP